jgi:hypothetical protein
MNYLKFVLFMTRWFKYDRDYLCVNKSQFVPVIFEPPCKYYYSCRTSVNEMCGAWRTRGKHKNACRILIQNAEWRTLLGGLSLLQKGFVLLNYPNDWLDSRRDFSMELILIYCFCISQQLHGRKKLPLKCSLYPFSIVLRSTRLCYLN